MNLGRDLKMGQIININFINSKKLLVFAGLMSVAFVINKCNLLLVWSNSEVNFDYYYNLSFIIICIQFILFPLIGLLYDKKYFQLFGIIGIQFHIINFWDNMMGSNCINNATSITKYLLIGINSMSIVLCLIFLFKSKIGFNKSLIFGLVTISSLVLSVPILLNIVLKIAN
jgi:hypothetical protein